MTEEMIKKFEEAGCKRWTKNGMDRLYINVGILGYRYERRRTGSIAWAELNGESISNSEMGRVLSYKSYIDIQTGELVAGGRDIDSEYKETVENFFKKVTEEATEEVTEEATEEVTEEATEEAAEEATEEAAEEATKKIWYAVQSDEEDNDWGTGSYDLEEAKKMAINKKYLRIAVIDGGECVGEILREDF